MALEPGEGTTAGWSFCWFFCLLTAYYMLRPVRETLGTSIGSERMDVVWLAVLVVMLAAAPLFSWVVARYPRRTLVPVVTRFFAVWLVAFSYLIYGATAPSFWVGCTYFVWLSVFNLFVVSLFWSVMADVFSSAQGKRLFGPIAAGGSLGGLLASLIVGNLAGTLGLAVLLLLPIAALEAGLFCHRRIESTLSRRTDRRSESDGDAESPEGEATGGSVWQGMLSVVRSPYLLGICLFLVLGKFCATVVYLHQLDVYQAEIAVIERRTQIFAWENAAVQVLTLAFQLFLASFLIRKLGLSWTLAVLPVALVAGFAAIMAEPTVAVLFTVQVLQRSGAYGLLNPAREVLFTVVGREEKYKAKSFIDTAIFRGGDAASASVRTMLVQGIGAGGVALVATACAAVWAVVGYGLGKLQQRKASSPT